MIIKTKVLDDSFTPIFVAQTEIDALSLMTTAESREAFAREKGQAFTAGAIPYFGQELIKCMQAGKHGDSIENEAIQVAMVAWLHDSIYGGVTAESFVKSDLEFTMTLDGIVKYDRYPSRPMEAKPRIDGI